MKIIVPMAGRGSRFTQHGVEIPKPLIPVVGRPIVAWALQSAENIPRSQIIFIALAEHEARYGVTEILRALAGPQAEVLLLDAVTEGQLCTVLAAREQIDSTEDILIASSDTYVISSLGEDIANREPDCAGLISVANLPGDRWSFARADETGQVVEVAEKKRISPHASTGLYYFASGREFVALAGEMIQARDKTLGEYYVIPLYQRYIQAGRKISLSLAHEMWDMGTPEALTVFEKHWGLLPNKPSESVTRNVA